MLRCQAQPTRCQCDGVMEHEKCPMGRKSVEVAVCMSVSESPPTELRLLVRRAQIASAQSGLVVVSIRLALVLLRGLVQSTVARVFRCFHLASLTALQFAPVSVVLAELSCDWLAYLPDPLNFCRQVF